MRINAVNTLSPHYLRDMTRHWLVFFRVSCVCGWESGLHLGVTVTDNALLVHMAWASQAPGRQLAGQLRHGALVRALREARSVVDEVLPVPAEGLPVEQEARISLRAAVIPLILREFIDSGAGPGS